MVLCSHGNVNTYRHFHVKYDTIASMSDEPPKIGRPRRREGETRRGFSISLGESEIAALQELARLRGEPQGVIVGRFVLQALEREKRKS